MEHGRSQEEWHQGDASVTAVQWARGTLSEAAEAGCVWPDPPGPSAVGMREATSPDNDSCLLSRQLLQSS